jgi:hypothetical protein
VVGVFVPSLVSVTETLPSGDPLSCPLRWKELEWRAHSPRGLGRGASHGGVGGKEQERCPHSQRRRSGSGQWRRSRLWLRGSTNSPPPPPLGPTPLPPLSQRRDVTGASPSCCHSFPPSHFAAVSLPASSRSESSSELLPGPDLLPSSLCCCSPSSWSPPLPAPAPRGWKSCPNRSSLWWQRCSFDAKPMAVGEGRATEHLCHPPPPHRHLHLCSLEIHAAVAAVGAVAVTVDAFGASPGPALVPASGATDSPEEEERMGKCIPPRNHRCSDE